MIPAGVGDTEMETAGGEKFAFPENLVTAAEACTPKVRIVSGSSVSVRTTPKSRKVVAPKCAAVSTSKKAVQPSSAKTPAVRSAAKTPAVRSAKGAKPSASDYGSTAAKSAMAAEIALQNQAVKRQKLDGGKARQIINVKGRALPHKSKLGPAGDTDLFTYAGRNYPGVAPYVSTAEMVKNFQTRTREIDLSRNGSLFHNDTASVIQKRHKLKLTRPIEPDLETAHRVRAVVVKSSAELEEEMLAKIPKFKARPLNKKILQGPSLAALPRSTPLPPEFHEFHLKTMERASQHAETSSVCSSQPSQSKPHKLTEPRPPHLETALRARPPMIKSSEELELEELEKIPKFKARPLNKKILESKGDLGLFCGHKPQVTTPQEFHFATNERLGPPATVTELFDKLSLHSEPHHEQHGVPRITIPTPFHLHTDERGAQKEKQFVELILQKQLEEERARVPKANPYPYTTDYPVMPPKPEPKPSTRPEAFQLESLVRHEEEMQRKLEERQRMEKEEAERRKFKAQPVIREDPLPLPERERKPLTEVQAFVLHVDHRAVHRSEFDKKIKEKEVLYKRMREECETAKMIEEEKAVKQMRRAMVPHARPAPKFDNPFLPQKSAKEFTKAVSPNLHVARREERSHSSRMR